jgi:hypothetical protein
MPWLRVQIPAELDAEISIYAERRNLTHAKAVDRLLELGLWAATDPLQRIAGAFELGAFLLGASTDTNRRPPA